MTAVRSADGRCVYPQPLGVLWTFGYQGLGGAEALRRKLAGTEVDTVVDIRLSPWSGNRAFSLKTRATVQAAGLRYVHLPDLGNLLYKSDGIQIRNMDAIEDVLNELRRGRNVALMCVCPDPTTCHRATLVEEALRRLPDLRVIHLYIDKGPEVAAKGLPEPLGL